LDESGRREEMNSFDLGVVELFDLPLTHSVMEKG
jgi:hypothetical protein